MAFWANVTSEAKRNYRFKITMSAFGGNNVLWWAKTATLPSYEVSEVEHNHMDNKYYFPGRVTWNTVSMTLVDPISPDATDLLNKLLVDAGYNIPGDAASAQNKKTISKNKAAGINTVEIQVLDADGIVVEQWTLQNAFLQSANFGSLDYSSDELKEIELTLRYDWAVCNAGGQERFKKGVSTSNTAESGLSTGTGGTGGTGGGTGD
jgi:hypothetical protein